MRLYFHLKNDFDDVPTYTGLEVFFADFFQSPSALQGAKDGMSTAPILWELIVKYDVLIANSLRQCRERFKCRTSRKDVREIIASLGARLYLHPVSRLALRAASIAIILPQPSKST